MLMLGKTLSVEQRLSKALSDIIGHIDYAPLTGVIIMGKQAIVDDFPTACTDGLDCKYGRKFVSDMPDAELRFLILHETFGHVLHRHLTVYRWMYLQDRQTANKACDYFINLKLVDTEREAGRGESFIKMPSCGLIDERFRGMDSAAIYKILRREKQEQGNTQGDSQDGDGDGDPQPGPGEPGGGFDEHDWEGAQERTDEEEKEIERTIDESIRQGILLAGKIGSGGIRNLKDLLPSKVDWKTALREFVLNTCAGNEYSTWRRPNRRFVSMGIYLPSGVSEVVGELVIAIDTSGSIGDRELSQFLGEIAAICKAVTPTGVRILYWDAEVCRDEYYTQDQIDNITSSTKPAGGGGTVIACVPAYLKDKNITPQAVIVFTDGYVGSNWGAWTCPVLFCILNNPSETASTGTTLHVEIE